MIPKIIHYCWFSGDEKPPLILKCIDSWKKYCPDYKIIEWNSSNFDVTVSKFAQEAHSLKKWAFVADYFRLWVLYNFGGIYLDSDVEIVHSFDDLLDTESFIGFETDSLFATCVLGSVEKNQWIKKLLSYYDTHPFIRNDSKLDMTPNPYIITPITKSTYPEIRLDNTFQHILPGLAIYPKEYFTPKDPITGELIITANTHSIHHFSGSWRPDEINSARTYSYEIITKHDKLQSLYHTKLGKKLIEKPILFLANCKANGLKYTITRTFEYLREKQ